MCNPNQDTLKRARAYLEAAKGKSPFLDDARNSMLFAYQSVLFPNAGICKIEISVSMIENRLAELARIDPRLVGPVSVLRRSDDLVSRQEGDGRAFEEAILNAEYLVGIVSELVEADVRPEMVES